MGDPEVGQNRFASLEQNVFRFDVPMDDPVLMRAGQGSDDVTGNTQGFPLGEAALAVQPLSE